MSKKNREIRVAVTEMTWQKWHELVYKMKYIKGTAKSEETILIRAMESLERELLG